MAYPIAPRIDPRLLAAIPRLDRKGRPIAEVNRRIGELAWTLGLVRPSYQGIREHVHRLRWRRQLRRHSRKQLGDALLQVMLRQASPLILAEPDYGAGGPETLGLSGYV